MPLIPIWAQGPSALSDKGVIPAFWVTFARLLRVDDRANTKGDATKQVMRNEGWCRCRNHTSALEEQNKILIVGKKM